MKIIADRLLSLANDYLAVARSSATGRGIIPNAHTQINGARYECTDLPSSTIDQAAKDIAGRTL
jgi:hypothetical protein